MAPSPNPTEHHGLFHPHDDNNDDKSPVVVWESLISLPVMNNSGGMEDPVGMVVRSSSPPPSSSSPVRSKNDPPQIPLSPTATAMPAVSTTTSKITSNQRHSVDQSTGINHNSIHGTDRLLRRRRRRQRPDDDSNTYPDQCEPWVDPTTKKHNATNYTNTTQSSSYHYHSTQTTATARPQRRSRQNHADPTGSMHHPHHKNHAKLDTTWFVVSLLTYWFYYEFQERFWALPTPSSVTATTQPYPVVFHPAIIIIIGRRIIILICLMVATVALSIEYVGYGLLYPERIRVAVITILCLMLIMVGTRKLHGGRPDQQPTTSDTGMTGRKTTNRRSHHNRNIMATILDEYVIPGDWRGKLTLVRITMTFYLFLFPTLIEFRTIQWLTNLIALPSTFTTPTTNYSVALVCKRMAFLVLPSVLYGLILRLDQNFICRCHSTHHSTGITATIISWWSHGGQWTQHSWWSTKTATTGTKRSTNRSGGSLKNSPWTNLSFGGWCPKYCYRRTGLYILYGLALYRILAHHGFSSFTEQRHLPNLLANFFITTAMLLYRSGDDGSTNSSFDVSSRTIRMALRRTLSEMVLQQQLTNNKTTDEHISDQKVLYMTLLHWIANHWDVSSVDQSSSTSQQPATNRTFANDVKPSTNHSSQQRQGDRTKASYEIPSKTAKLDDLLKMSSPTTSNANISSSPDVQQEPSSKRTSHFTGYSQNSSFGGESKFQQHSNHRSNQDAMQNLHATLRSMNLDERAKPAVLGYKRVVQNFPPTYVVAAALGLFRRSATIQLLLIHVFAYLCRWHSFPYATIGLLLPFVYMEMVRIYLWMLSCHEASNNMTLVIPSQHQTLPNIEPMILLLMDENYISTLQLPKLIVVWQNVNTSVEVAELSLTVTRCVQTTTVANDLISNIMTLVHLAYEIIQYGWIHGITVIGKELVHLHSTGTDPSMLWHGASSPSGASYTSATISLLRNVDIIRRNVHVLSEAERENIGKVIAPILGFLALIVGQGWLWGRQNGGAEVHSSNGERTSSIEIVELAEDDDIAEFRQEVKKVNDANTGTKMMDLFDGNKTYVSTPTTTDSLHPIQPQTKNSMLMNTSDDTTEFYVNPPTDTAVDEKCKLVIKHNVIELIDSHAISNPCRLVATCCMDIDSKPDGDCRVDTKENCATEVSIEDISEMMELLSQCDEYRLLDTIARNAILVKLAEFKHDSNESFRQWYETIRSNLRNLLEAREVMQNNLRQLVLSTEVVERSETVKSDSEETTTANATHLSCKNDNNPVSSSLPKDSIDHLDLDGDGGDGAMSVSSQEDEESMRGIASCEANESVVTDVHSDSKETTTANATNLCFKNDDSPASSILPNDSIDHLDLDGDSGRGAISVSSHEDEGTMQGIASCEANESVIIQSALRWPICDDDDEFQPIEFIPTVEHPFNVEPTNSNDEPMEKCMNDEEENIWLKIGSGVAILGGIVGGVVMMNAVKNRNHDRDKKQ